MGVSIQEQVVDVVTLEDTASLSARSDLAKTGAMNGTGSENDGAHVFDHKAPDLA